MFKQLGTNTCEGYRSVICCDVSVFFYRSVILRWQVSIPVDADLIVVSFNSRFGMSSGPGALDGMSLDYRSLITPSFATVSSSISGYGFPGMLGIWSIWPRVNTELNCRPRISAFSVLELCNFPFSLSDATPSTSFLWDLMYPQNGLWFPSSRAVVSVWSM